MSNHQQVFQRKLSTGTVTVVSQQYAPLDDLFEIAERRNPKRAFLFVSKLLGRHIPIKPNVMRDSYKTLASRMPDDLPEPVLFIGMAETAVGLAAGVYQEASASLSESVFLTSTRHPVDGDLLCEFKENHSHATDHLIYWPEDPTLTERVEEAKTLVLIDDEATTGNTFANLYAALMDAGLDGIEHLVAVTLTDWSQGALMDKVDVPALTSISLAQGQWSWEADPQASSPVMPSVNVTAKGAVDIVGPQCWGRLGMDETFCRIGLHIETVPADKVLVLGTSEFVWQPFLLAEKLEKQGADVYFSSTSRSPIAIGHAIKSAITFTDNYGLGIPNFAYNIAHQRFDRIYLCCETPADGLDPLLLTELKAIANYVEIITYE
ncbi:adenine/guanine phosphoribosyltransferase [Aeromonas sp. 1805]|uniref:phosphoribosyltransferase domain-containing protein n=1 Tax=Aeromonas sp. 1805 TaxID=2560028 RepID=UPI00148B119E|nr:phosphoribosyltransferase domain-containing protein [Aeromonas sp. 1805]QJT19613.1 adenine/guanine phosphoribosyltransferase [Aeromonas sp. 1805]